MVKGNFPMRQNWAIVIRRVSVMPGIWLSRIIILPYCEKGPWRRRWQRKPEDGTIVIWLLNCPIIQIFDHQIFDQIQSHQIKYQYFCKKCQKQVGWDVHLLLAMPPARKSSSESSRSGKGGKVERRILKPIWIFWNVASVSSQKGIGTDQDSPLQNICT